MKPLRHVVHVAELTDDEAAELGPLLRRSSSAVASQLTEVVQVYNCLWSHADGRPDHVHFVVQPVSKEQVEQFGSLGPKLQAEQFAANDRPSDADVERVAAHARALFARQ